jgi:hypothetical protein
MRCGCGPTDRSAHNARTKDLTGEELRIVCEIDVSGGRRMVTHGRIADFDYPNRLGDGRALADRFMIFKQGNFLRTAI